MEQLFDHSGLHDCVVVDYLKAKPIREAQGVVTNHPYKLTEHVLISGRRQILQKRPLLAQALRRSKILLTR
jgi:hypothetical protein